jgi:SAM-dependent methyltransferase
MEKTQLAVSSLLAFTSPKSWMRRVQNFFRRTGQSVAAPGASRAITRLVREWLGAHSVGGPHLDVGCGARSRLSAGGLQVHGVDSDERSVATFNSNGGRAVVASSTELPFPAGTFGAVWSFGLLHHLDDAELEKSLGEMERVVMPGGWIVVFDAVLPRSGWRRPLAAIVRALDKGRHMRTEERLRAVLTAHGEWECRRVTYSWNGLEALFCSHHKPSEQTPPAPCPSPPTSS